MNYFLILVSAFLFILVFAFGSFYINHTEKKYKQELERKEKEKSENEKRTSAIIQKTSEKKANIRTSNNSDNFNNSIDVLHKYAKDITNKN